MERPCVPTPSASDEEFWRRNEGYFTERLGQPCCTLAGISSLLAHMPGEFAVVVHGEMDCLNNFSHAKGVSLPRFYCTNITQKEFSSGDTARPLRECLEAVISERRPKAIFILSMCLMEMIHDDFPAVAAEVSKRFGVPIVALRTSGLQVVSQAEYTDAFYLRLAGLFEAPPAREPGLVNIVGLPRLEPAEKEELGRVLKLAGLRLNASFPEEGSLEHWRLLRSAEANLIVDGPLYPKFVEGLAGLGMACEDVPLPVGLASTRSFFTALGRRGGRAPEVEPSVIQMMEAASRKVAAFREQFSGLRLAAGLRMSNFSAPGQLALDGLAEIEAFVEMGFDVTLLVQGPPERKARGRFQDHLQGLGWSRPMMVFAEPNELPAFLGSGRFDAAYLGDHARGYAHDAGIAFIESGLRPFFSGMEANVRRVARAVEQCA